MHRARHMVRTPRYSLKPLVVVQDIAESRIFGSITYTICILNVVSLLFQIFG